MVLYLKLKKMKQLTEHWTEKSEKETIQKQIDLDKLKANRAKDLERYQSLAKTVSLIFCLFLKIIEWT